MIFETWFLFALMTTVVSGAVSFIFKIASVEKLDIVVMSFLSSILSTIILGICVFFYSDFKDIFHPVILFSIATQIAFLGSTVLKVKGLDVIDSAIFFPLYKVMGPLVVIVFGILFFNEEFTYYEWIGLLVSLTVPFLLISKLENSRQKNLKLGILIVAATSIVGAISAAFWKGGSVVAPNLWLFIFLTEFVKVFISMTIMIVQHKRQTVVVMTNMLSRRFLFLSFIIGVSYSIASAAFVFAFALGGSLGIVYTINSLYILIPIVLSIIFYNEHWNARKVIAIILSIVALGFFG